MPLLPEHRYLGSLRAQLVRQGIAGNQYLCLGPGGGGPHTGWGSPAPALSGQGFRFGCAAVGPVPEMRQDILAGNGRLAAGASFSRLLSGGGAETAG